MTAPIEVRRRVFAERLAAGMTPRKAELGLGLNGPREARREDVQAMAAEFQKAATLRKADRLEGRPGYCPECQGNSPGGVICAHCQKEKAVMNTPVEPAVPVDRVSKRPEIERVTVSYEPSAEETHALLMSAIFGDSNVADHGTYSPERGAIEWESNRRNLLDRIRVQRLAGSDHKAATPQQIAEWRNNG